VEFHETYTKKKKKKKKKKKRMKKKKKNKKDGKNNATIVAFVPRETLRNNPSKLARYMLMVVHRKPRQTARIFIYHYVIKVTSSDFC
jgi:hypothetical protein